MNYFVKFNSAGEAESISISKHRTEIETENAYYVSENECMCLKKHIAEKIEAENKAAEEFVFSYDELLEKNSQLEAENASLLYQVLTGEELTDV